MKIIKVKIFLLVFVICFVPAISYALLAEHLNYNGCDTCHNLHGGYVLFGALLNQETSESTCLMCHGPLGIATEAAIHGTSGQISCLECHNPHNNDRDNILGGSNILLLGMEFDANDTDGSRSLLPTPQIREETGSGLGPLKEIVFEVTPDDWHRPSDSYGVCNACHTSIHNEGNDCRGCHTHSGGFAGAGCTGCHDGNGAGALRVSVHSPHSTNTIFNSIGVAYTCENCHTAHEAGNIQIPDNSTVGIFYNSSGHNGISLGADDGNPNDAVGTTEAEICWNCHNTYGVSEWGLNSDSNGTASNYNSGLLNPGTGIGWYTDTTPGSEVGATWTSANADFAYKTSAIQSTHSVNNSATLPGLDPVANIRCSYCHDVHDANILASDNSSGKPYLRGTWMGNPYREDGAPFDGQTYVAQNDFGAVPRGGIGANEFGGYQIDQNNGNPTSTWDLYNSAGLCIVCHGDNVDSMNYFDVDESGIAELPSDSWVGTNGHSNAVLGGTGSVKANIFREDWRKPNDGYVAPSSASNGYYAGSPNMAYQQLIASARGFGFRGGAATDGEGFYVEPTLASQPYAYAGYNWGATVDELTIDDQYHQFSCSKCHNPHASRLPRLMITNCLDVSHNTWDDAPTTMLRGDVITISGAATGGSRDCSADVNSAHTVDYLNLSSNEIIISDSFTSGCSRQDITLTWQGSPYTLTSVTFTAPDTITLNAPEDFEDNFIGKVIPSSGSISGGTLLYPVGTDNDGVTITRGTSAQNCHRYIDWNNDGDAADLDEQPGWNTVTPW